MSIAQDIIGEIGRQAGYAQALLTKLMGTDYTRTSSEREAVMKAQTNLALWQKRELHALQKAYEG